MIQPPETCPYCGAPTHLSVEPKSGIKTVWCSEPNTCPGVLVETLVYLGSRDVLEIDQLGPEFAKIIVDNDFVTEVADLFEFANDLADAYSRDPDKFREKMTKLGLPPANTVKFVTGMQFVQTSRPWDRWLVAMCIEGIGKVLAKQLVTALDLTTFDKLPSELMRIPSLGLDGLGEAKLTSICQWASQTSNRDLCRRLHDAGCRPKCAEKVKTVVVEGAPLSGMVICITGEHLGVDREELQRQLQILGATIKTGVSKKLTHLVAGSGAGPSKIAKAKELGILVLSTDWLKKTFEENGVNLHGGAFSLIQDLDEL